MRRTALTRPATPPTLAVEKRSEPACQATLPRAMACRWRADGMQMAWPPFIACLPCMFRPACRCRPACGAAMRAAPLLAHKGRR
jgi:hypothetical protein